MANKMERFTQRARRVLSLAQEEAEQLQHNLIDTEHLLLGLLREEGGIGGRVLRETGLERERTRELATELTRAEALAEDTRADLSADTKKTLELAVDEARRMGHSYIGTEHLLLGLLRTEDGVAIVILNRLGISTEEVRRQVNQALLESPTDSDEPAAETALGAGGTTDASPATATSSAEFDALAVLRAEVDVQYELLKWLGQAMTETHKAEARGFIDGLVERRLKQHFQLSDSERTTIHDSLRWIFRDYDEEQLFMLTPGGGQHGGMVALLNRRVGAFIEGESLGHTTAGGAGYVLKTEDDGRLLIATPDFAFTRTERLPGGLPEHFIPLAPDLAVEIVMPSHDPAEFRPKIDAYLKHGTQVVWVMQPHSKIVAVHTSGETQVLTDQDTLDGGDLLPGFSLPVADLFA